MRLIEGKFNGKKLVSGRWNGVYVFNTKYQTFVNFTVGRFKYSKTPFSFNNWSMMVIYLELTEKFDSNADNNTIIIGNGERKTTFELTDAEYFTTDTGTIMYREYVDITTEDFSDGDYFQAGADLTDGAVIPISITFTNSKGQVETYNNYDGDYAQPVYDNTAPTITLNGGTEIHVDLDTSYTDEGVTVGDNYLPEYATIDKTIIWYSLTGRSKTVTSIDTSVEGRYNVSYTAYDTANNKTNVTQLIYIDNPAELSVNVSYDASTAGQTKAIITANKVIKLPTGWTYVDENEKSIYKIYTQTTSENVSIYDLQGKSKSISVEASIKAAPVYQSLGIVKNRNAGDKSSQAYAKTGDSVRVLLSFAEALAIEPVVTINNNKYTATYRESSSNPANNVYYYMADFDITSAIPEGEIMFTIGEYADSVGNVGKTLTNSDINMSSFPSVTVDRVLPVLTIKTSSVGTAPYYSNINFSLYDNIKFRNYILNGVEGTSSSAQYGDVNFDNIKNQLIEGENKIVLEDLAGNQTTKVFIYDKTAPTVVSEKREESEGSITVVLTLSEKIQLPVGWAYGENSSIISKVFTEDFSGTINLVDLAGNLTEHPLEVTIQSSVPVNVKEVKYNIEGKGDMDIYYTQKTGILFISILTDKILAKVPTFSIFDIGGNEVKLSGSFVGEQDDGYYYTATYNISLLEAEFSQRRNNI